MAKQVLGLESEVRLHYRPKITQESVQPVEKSPCLTYTHSFPS